MVSELQNEGIRRGAISGLIPISQNSGVKMGILEFCKTVHC
jgi:hypothetical protein